MVLLRDAAVSVPPVSGVRANGNLRPADVRLQFGAVGAVERAPGGTGTEAGGPESRVLGNEIGFLLVCNKAVLVSIAT